MTGSSLSEPCAGVDGDLLIPAPGDNTWYTPMYFRDLWHYRRLGQVMDRVILASPQQAEPRDVLETEAVPEPEPLDCPAPQLLDETGMGQLTFF